MSAPAGDTRTNAVARLKSRGLHAQKRFGQNFLTDANVCRRIAEAAMPGEVTPRGTVLEIGPGLGALTTPLLGRAGHVVAVDLDPEMIACLADDFAPEIAAGALTLVHGDGVAIDWLALLAAHPAPHVVTGNLPYLVTGRFLEHAVRVASQVERVVFMVQLEVAERLIAAPGTKEYGALTVFVRASYEVLRLLVVKAGAFHPRPDVDSAVVVLTPRAMVLPETDTFRALVRAGFAMRRKTLRNTWRALGELWPTIEAVAAELKLDLGLRAETLSPEQFDQIASAVDRHRGVSPSSK